MRYLVALALCLGSVSAKAALIEYDFTAANLSGRFALDDLGQWDTTATNDGQTIAYLRSPLQQISGTVGGYDFIGSPYLHILDLPEFWPNGVDVPAPDMWMVKSAVSSNEINGISVNFVGLYLNIGAGWNSLAITPPPTSRATYSIGFSDGTSWNGDLVSLLRAADTTSVPEPATLSLFGAGLLGMLAARRRAK